VWGAPLLPSKEPAGPFEQVLTHRSFIVSGIEAVRCLDDDATDSEWSLKYWQPVVGPDMKPSVLTFLWEPAEEKSGVPRIRESTSESEL
jgi:hypothetical protein